jgi:phage terminase large subunit-like protein
VGDSLLVREMRACGGPAAFFAKYGEAEIRAALASWPYIARPQQLEPDWSRYDHWFVLAGRGFGKTRTGAETVTGWARKRIAGRMALVAPTAADARDVMVEGESGILAVSERQRFPAGYEPSKRRVTWPNGATATLFSAEEPKRLRGPQHDAYWADELPWWADVQNWRPGSEAGTTAWDQLQFGLRLGVKPRGIITATPRAIALVRALIKDPRVKVTKGSTYDNAANLAASFLRAIRSAYEGTRLGRQELNAEVLDDNPNALWKQVMIDLLRVAAAPMDMQRSAVAVDPAVTANEDSDQTGIVSGGIAPCRMLPACKGEMHAFVFDDESGIYTPSEWAQKACGIYHARSADRVIGEVNNGGDLVEANLRANGDATVSYRAVHASRGKVIRAEPIAALYEQGKVHHVGTHGKLEDEMTQWDPLAGMRSPSRMDALVWLLTDLMLGEHRAGAAPRRPGAGRRI